MINKKNLIFFLIFILLNNCSFDNKTGIWGDSEKEKRKISELEKKQKQILDVEKIYSSESIYLKDKLLTKNIILSKNKELNIRGATVTNTIEEAIEISRSNNDDEIFIIGGGEIYNLGIPLSDKLYITEIHSKVDGDTYFPVWNKKEWKEISRITHQKDKNHNHSFDFVIYVKKN